MKLLLLALVCGLGLPRQEALAQMRNYTSSQKQINQKKFVGPYATSMYPKAMCILEPTPSFPGGYDSLVAYLRRNLRYPASPKAEGKVFVGFIITKAGQVTHAEVLKGLHPTYDAEALRVVRQMPRWVQPPRPQPIEVRYTLPITFSRK